MKHLFSILLIFAASLTCTTFLHAQQWEQVGWQGGIIEVRAQLGKTLFGQGYNVGFIGTTGTPEGLLTEIYRSTDEGRSWKIFRKGLPILTWTVYIKVSGDYVYLFPDRFQNETPAFDNIGAYVAKETDTTWTHLPFSPIYGSSPFDRYNTESFDPLMFFSNDTILVQFRDLSVRGKLYLSADRGKSWAPINTTGIPFETHYINHRAFVLADNDSGKTLFFSSGDAGITWKNLLLPPGADTSYSGPPFFFNDSLLFYFNSKDSNSYRSIDGGENWVRIDLPYPNFFRGRFFSNWDQKSTRQRTVINYISRSYLKIMAQHGNV